MGDVQYRDSGPEDWFNSHERLRDRLRASVEAFRRTRMDRAAAARSRLASQPADFTEKLGTVLRKLDQSRDTAESVLRHCDLRRSALPDFLAARRGVNELANEPGETVADRETAELCRLYTSSTPEQRSLIRDLVACDLPASLFHFAWRMAVRTIRTGSVEHLEAGLTALSIENKQTDFRDTYRFMSLLSYAAKRARIDPVPSFRKAASISSTEMARWFVRDAFVPPTAEQRLRSLGVVGGQVHSQAAAEEVLRSLGESVAPPIRATIESLGFRERQGPNGPILELNPPDR